MLIKVPFHLHGPHGVLQHLKYLIETKGSAVVCLAEGAGQVSHSVKSFCMLIYFKAIGTATVFGL